MLLTEWLKSLRNRFSRKSRSGITKRRPALRPWQSSVENLEDRSLLSAFGLGDIAFTGYQGSGTDKISFVLLKDISGTSTLTLNDSAWTGSALNTNEGTSVITFSGSFNAGTQFNFDAGRGVGAKWTVGTSTTGLSDVTSGNFALNASGDNLFAYDGSTAPAVGNSSLWVAAMATNAFLTSGSATTSLTYLPSAFTLGDTAFSLGITNGAGNENGSMTSPATVSGTASQVRATVNTVGNWTTFTSAGGQAVPPNITFTVSTNNPGVTLTQSGNSTEATEGGAGDSYTVVLTTQPTSNVTITVDPDDQINLGSGPGVAVSLLFTTANWNVAQTVNVTAVDDSIVEGNHSGAITHSVASSDAGYNGLSVANVTVAITDNDTPGITVNQSGGTTAVTEGGATDTYTVVLASQPAANVVIAVDPDDQIDLGAGPGVAVNLTFTTANWQTPQTVTVTAVNDAAIEGPHSGTITHSVSSADAAYNGFSVPDITVSITDNDVPVASGLYINEVLFNPPGTDAPNEYVEIRGTPNYVIPIGVYFIGIEGDSTAAPGDVQNIFDLGGLTIGSNGYLVLLQAGNTYTVSGSATVLTATGTGFGGLAGYSGDAGATDIENSSATFMLLQASAAPTLNDDIDANNDGVADGSIYGGWTVLDSIGVVDAATDAAYSNVVYSTSASFASSTGKDVVTTTAAATYLARTGTSTGNTSADWFGGATTGNAPNFSTGATDVFPANFANKALNHIGSQNPSAVVAGVTITESAGSTDVTEGGATDTYQIALQSTPTSTVQITVTADADTQVSTDGVTYSASLVLSFTGTTAQTVHVRAIDDAFAEGAHTGTITHAITSSSDSDYPLSTSIASVTAHITDNDNTGVIVTESGGTTVLAEGGATDTYTIALASQPTSTVQITVTADADTEVSIDGVTYAASLVLSFTSTAAKTVTVRAVDDSIVEGNHSGTITQAITTSSDSNYPLSTVIANVVASISDNDIAVASGLYINEILFNPPGNDAPNEYIEIRGAANYVIPDGVYLLGIEGDSGTGAGDVQTIFNLSGLTIGSNGYLVLRQSGNGYTVNGSATSQSGTGTGFGGLTGFSADSSGTDIENASVTFLLMQSSVAPTLTNDIDSDNDGAADGSVYSGWNVLDGIAVLAANNASAYTHVVFSTAATFTGSTGKDIVTTTAAANYVARVGVSTGNTATDWFGGEVAGTAPNWALGATGVYPSAFANQALDNIGSRNPDTPVLAGVTITESAGSTDVTEGSVTDTYSIGLLSTPNGVVEITVTGDADTEVSADGVTYASFIELVFNNSAAAKTVYVRAINDAFIEGPHTGTITHTITSSSDSSYPTGALQSVTVHITDNDSPGVTVTQSGGTTVLAEGGATDTYTIALDTVPSGTVQITVTADADTEVSTDGVTFAASVVLSFTNTAAKTVTVRAVDDAIIEGAHSGTITHAITSSSDSNYPLSTTIASVVASITDNDVEVASGLYINEILFNPPGTDAPNEYIEIRGAANYVIPSGVYLLGIEGDSGTGAGDVQTMFNLGGLTIGSNGYLVLRQSGNGYTVNGSATSQSGTGTGFGGLAGFSADSSGTDIENASVTFLLMQSSVAPTLTNDIDSDNDGTADGAVYSGWNILDGIAVLSANNASAYTHVVFSTAASFNSSTGKDIVATTAAANYVARVGTSTGNTAADWFGGEVAGTAPNWTLGATGVYPSAFANQALDNIGSQNPDTPVTNDPPVITSNSTFNVPENTTAVATVTATDADLDHLTFAIAGGDDAGKFAINPDTGVLTFVSAPNFESPADIGNNNVYNVTVSVSDGVNPAVTQSIAVTVTDANEAPTAVTVTNATTSLPEYTDTSSDIKLADINVTDDALGTNVLSLAGTDAAYFKLIGNALYLKADTELDFETKSSYAVTIQVNDAAVGATPDATYAFSLSVTNVTESGAPVIGAFDTTITYKENAVPLSLDTNATVVDADSPDLVGGKLIVDLTVNGEPGDQLSIRNVGTAAGQIGVSGSDVTFGGTVFATFSGGTNGNPLVIKFKAGSTPAAVQALVRVLAFSSTSDNLVAPKTVRVRLNDGLGGVAAPVTKQINVTPANDKPVIDNFSGLVTYTEDQPGVAIAPTATVTDPDSANFDLGKLIVRVSPTVDRNDRIEIRNDGTGAGQIGTNGIDTVTFGGVTIGTYAGTSALTVTLNANATPAAVQALVRNLTFRNITGGPSTLPRTITATVSDGDGGTSLLTSTTVNVIALNDDPVLSGFEPDVTYRENAAPLLIDSNTSVVDVDLLDFEGGVLTVDLTANGAAEDRLSIRNVGTADRQVGVNTSTGEITYSGILVATFTGGTSGSDPLVITFNSAAKQAAVLAVTRNLTFVTLTDDPSTAPRTVRLRITDGDGGTSNEVTKLINIAASNDKPVIDNFVSSATFTEDQDPVVIAPSSLVTDVDSSNFDTGKLTVRAIVNGQATDRISIRNQGTGAGQIGFDGVDVTYGGTVIGTAVGTTSLTVTLNANATPAAVQALLRNVTFSSISQAPSTLPRTISATVSDGDGGTSLVVTANVNVVAVNDNPVIGAFDTTVNYKKGAVPVRIDTNATVTDVDLLDFAGGVMTVDFVGGSAVDDDRLSIQNQGTAVGQVGVSGSDVTFGGLVVGSFTGGNSGSVPLVITFNTNATQVAVQAILRYVTFANVSANPTLGARTVRVQLTDGDGGTAAQVTKTVNVTL